MQRMNASTTVKLKLVLTVVLAFMSAAVIAGCNSNIRNLNNQRPNILLITMEATSAKNFHCYGYPWEVSPSIDALAKDGYLFENFYSGGDFTPISLATIMTSTPLPVHCLSSFESSLSPELPSLAESLSDAGYHTFMGGESAGILEPMGLSKGFESRIEGLWKDHQVNGEKLTREALRFIKTHRDKPFFAWLHYIEPHAPYNPPEPFAHAFTADNIYSSDQRIVTDAELVHYIEGTKYFFERSLIQPGPAKRTVRDYVAAHDGEILYADDMIAYLFEELRELKLYDRTVIAFTTDHGELMGEHGIYFTHGAGPYEALIHVPFILKPPGKPAGGKRIDALAGHIDIAPTLLSYAGVPIPDGMLGMDLRPILNGHMPKEPRIILSGAGSGFALVSHGVKLTVTSTPEGSLKHTAFLLGESGTEELELLPNDPRLSEPIFQKLESMVPSVLDMLSQCRKKSKRPLSQKEIELLKSMGYMK